MASEGLGISNDILTALAQLKLGTRQFFFVKINSDFREIVLDDGRCTFVLIPLFWIKQNPPPPLTSTHFDWIEREMREPTWMNSRRCAVCNLHCDPGKHWISDETYEHWSLFRPGIKRSYICDKEMAKLQFQCCDYFDSTYQLQKRDLGLFEKLNMDILSYCFSFCDAVSLCHLSQTSQSMHNLIMSEPIWKKFSEQYFPHCLYDPMAPFLMNSPIICGYKHATLTYTRFERAVSKEKITTSSRNQEMWEYVLQQLPPDDCRYLVFRFFPDDSIGSYIVFVLWAPDKSKIKSKMIYAGSKDALKKACQGINCEVQATDIGELGWDVIYERVKRPIKN